MKKILLTLLFSTLCLALAAQDFEIVSVESLPADFSAREEIKADHSDRQCALLRIATQNIVPNQREGFSFVPDLGSEVVERATRDGEIWLWVSPGLKYLRIKHREWGQYELRMPDYVARVEALHTYKVVIRGTLAMPLQEQANNAPTQQYLAFQISPTNAVLEVEGKIWEVEADGSSMQYVPFGKYDYQVRLENYHTYSGSVVVADPDNTHKVVVNLSPNFGWIEIKGNDVLDDANVYIDNALAGKVPFRSVALKSGKHSVRIVKKLYDEYSETVTVTDNQTVSLSPTLSANFAEVTLKVDADAEIWVNNEKKGIRTWTGVLGSGMYRIECKQESHETTVTTKEIVPKMHGQTLTLATPRPIYGSLNVVSTPNFAKIYLDGHLEGETPKFIREVIIGTHSLRLEKEGCATLNKTITIAQGETLEVQEKLETDHSVVVTTDSDGNEAPVDGPVVGATASTVSFATLNAAYDMAYTPSYGFCVGQVRRVGWFVTAMSNFSFDAMDYAMTADSNGLVDGYYPYYNGTTYVTRLSVMGGLVLKVVGPLCFRLGAGYGWRTVCDGTVDGNLVKVANGSVAGIDATSGLQVNLKRLTLSLDAITTGFQTIEVKLGLGYCWKKK